MKRNGEPAASVTQEKNEKDTTNGDFQTSDDAGIIGMDMVNQFDCVTINLKEMFLKLE